MEAVQCCEERKITDGYRSLLGAGAEVDRFAVAAAAAAGGELLCWPKVIFPFSVSMTRAEVDGTVAAPAGAERFAGLVLRRALLRDGWGTFAAGCGVAAPFVLSAMALVTRWVAVSKAEEAPAVAVADCAVAAPYSAAAWEKQPVVNSAITPSNNPVFRSPIDIRAGGLQSSFSATRARSRAGAA